MIEHLADEHVAPRPVRGEQPSDQRTDGHRDRAARHHDAVGAGPVGLDEVRCHQCHDRRHHQRGADALEERPAEHQHREIRRQRGRQRTARVDHTADRECTLPAEDRAHLPAGDHERGHHQRVHGDRGLDPGDRGAEVARHGRDRHVHHRRVEDHHELSCRQRDEHSLGCRARAALGRPRGRCHDVCVPDGPRSRGSAPSSPRTPRRSGCPARGAARAA